MTNAGRCLVLLRHGYSEWNQTRRFTGWTDVPLNDQGWAQTAAAGRSMGSHGIGFDEVHTSLLKRTYQMTDKLLEAAGHSDIPRYSNWRLNERHYGQLQGMSKDEIFAIWGEQAAHGWWRGYFQAPPPLGLDDPRHPRFDPLYAELDPVTLPCSESLYDCQQRVLPYWQQVLVPRLIQNRHLLVISHGNTLRSLIMHIDKISAKAIEKVEVPSGVPLIYRFNDVFKVSERVWLR